MSDDFDPYYQWLGISPKHQPPNHYRLLGVELFESHPDVISSAADQRMAHVRSFQSGQRGKISQCVLNDLSMARLCLLDPEKKAAYDAKLREQLTAQRSANSVGGVGKGSPALKPSARLPVDFQAAEAEVTAGDLLSDIRAASRLTVLEAERLRLTKFDLPAATQALGENIYREGRLRRELSEPFASLDPWKPPAEGSAGGGPTDASGQGAGDVVIRLRERAIAVKRGREVDNLFRTLGEEGFRKLGDEAGPAEVTEPLQQLKRELARIEAEIGELSKRGPAACSTRAGWPSWAARFWPLSYCCCLASHFAWWCC